MKRMQLGAYKQKILIGVLLVLAGFAAAQVQNLKREPLGIEQQDGIRVVYQIKTDGWKKGVGSGLHYVEKLANAYAELGLADENFEIYAVLHGDAGYWLLKDGAYRKETGKDRNNPNKAIVERLIQRGVSVELCAQTMKSHGWKAEDVLPGVTLVIGAYPRIIDLQQRGCAYIRF